MRRKLINGNICHRNALKLKRISKNKYLKSRMMRTVFYEK